VADDDKTMEAVAPHPDQAHPLELAATAASAQHHDLGAFLATVEQRAFRIVRAVIWDDHAALDVVQDAMLRLVEKYSRRPAVEWPALFFTILANRTRDVRRWRQLRARVERLSSRLQGHDDGPQDDPMAGFGDPSPNADPMQSASSTETAAAIEKAVAGLPARQREAFLLREWQGLDVRQTAELMGCSEGSVKQHHFRALRALRAKLTEVWEND